MTVISRIILTATVAFICLFCSLALLYFLLVLLRLSTGAASCL